MKRRSLFTKLLLGNLLLIIVIVAVSGLVAYYYLNVNYQREMEGQQRRTVQMMQHHFLQVWLRDPNGLDSECKKLFADVPARLTVIAANGVVLGESQADSAKMENHKTSDRPEVLAALQGGFGSDVRSSETLGVDFRYFAEPIEADGKVFGAVRVAMPVETLAEGGSLIRNSLLWSALMGAIAAIGLAVLLSWTWYAPLKRITLTARRIASGNLKSRVRIPGSSELAQLGLALNEMAGSLAEKIRQVDSQRSSLDAVVRNLREGVVALDAEGRVMLMNTSAQALLEVGDFDVQGKRLQEVVRIADVVTVFNHVKDVGESASKQTERDLAGGSRILEVLAVRVAEPSASDIRFLIVVRDITEPAKTAKIRSEFAANASHELRTPLATIRVAVDSLRSLGPDDTAEFDKIVGMLDRHTTRLEEMTKDLLSLHTLETGRQRVKLEEMGTGPLVRWAQEQFAPKADQRSIDLQILAEDPERTFTSDLSLLQLMLQNLIDNALKFTPEAGRVECHIQLVEDHLLLQVSDTGCGIPPDSQDRVFERFFQVESARSGATGTRGTGLGLAIVKHAAERLGGSVSLQSELGKGTTVRIRLPISPV